MRSTRLPGDKGALLFFISRLAMGDHAFLW